MPFVRDPRLTAEEELMLRQTYGLFDLEASIPDILIAGGAEETAPVDHEDDDDDGDDDRSL